MSAAWEVTSFAVQTSTANQKTDSVYANGRMQVPVIVTVKAVNGTTGASYELTDAELKTIKLRDYYTSTELTGTWFYSTTENEFAHTLGNTRDPVTPIADGTKSIVFWVSSTKVENKNIAAFITQPNGTSATTAGGTFNSFVTLTGLQRVDYTTRNVTIEDEDTAKGTWKSTRHSNNVTSVSSYEWQQNNHYVTSDVHPILKAELHDYITSGSQVSNGSWSSSRLVNSFAYLHKASPLDIFYFWVPGLETSQVVGVREFTDAWDINENGHPTGYTSTDLNATATIQVNQKSNAFCLTRMKFLGNKVWGKTFQKDSWFRLYDTLGNSGDFYPKVRESTDENGEVQYTLYLQNKNTATSSTGLASLQPAAKL
ncbi:hypothetical protein ASPCADRAFT_202496 [Aspergillus carbonarius ITEM 5010]|uniref:Uncharacterized protein n=1 Tax=Aspergillus carbonarius (strain ITEM 5010) TaxID=602072 RepID=A0A1R3S1U4_ASPC5|nr:hypothetical protein ASPCADRAFT_202496 [Aspergillus carbonarius ITEM 5010]